MSAGRLRIFLGMCPGVGKTYSMLLAAQQRQEEGVKVVIGWVETHGRIETAALTAGLRRIPPREFEHRGVALQEMDLDAILERRPTLVLVDELAHTNVPGSRHPKRYQDVLEILEAGIDVYSTVNVQHLESLRDAVAGITGVAVRETLPDSVLDHAAEIELIDVTPEQLRARLGEGKVYGGDRADRAADAFFREGNLRALREMALRVVADRADRQVRGFLKDNAIQGPWRSRERLMVAVGGSPHAEGLIRITKRIADALDATWIAVHVEAGDAEDESTRARTAANLSLARSLGAETISVSGTDPVEALLDCSRRENATQIVLGKTTESTWWSRLAGTGITERLARQSDGVDLLLVHSDEAAAGPTARLRPAAPEPWIKAAAVLLGTSLVAAALEPVIGYRSVTMVYMLGVAVAGLSLTRLPLIALAVMSGISWNLLFTQPRGSLAMWHSEDVFLLLTFLIVALVIGHQTARLLRREASSQDAESRARALYELTRILSSSDDLTPALARAIEQIERTFGCRAWVLLGREQLAAAEADTLTEKEWSVCQWSLKNRVAAGRFTGTLPESTVLAIPLLAADHGVGVLALRPLADDLSNPLRRDLLEAFGAHLAVLVERAEAQRVGRDARVQADSHRLQRALLDDVAHELRTPVAVIGAAVERLGAEAEPTARAGLLDDVKVATRRLDRVMTQLVTLSRLEAGLIEPRPEVVDATDFLEEVVADVRRGRERVVVECEDFTFSTDASLLHTALSNLLHNAIRYSPDGTPVTLRAAVRSGQVELVVEDRGPGIPADQRERLFERFQRGDVVPEGMGLGLSIAKQFVASIRGTLSADERPGGGAIFCIRLPFPR